VGFVGKNKREAGEAIKKIVKKPSRFEYRFFRFLC
jgi:hypothetical protein